jgi:hypothetical protein
MKRSSRSDSLPRLATVVLILGLALLPMARAHAAMVPFTGNLTIDFTANGGTASPPIAGAGMVNVNGAGGPSLEISKLTIPGAAFVGAYGALVDGPGTVTAYYGMRGLPWSNAPIVLSQGGACTAPHANVSCPGGGLAGFGGLPGLKAYFLFFFSTLSPLTPTGNVGAGSQAAGTTPIPNPTTPRSAILSAAGWTTGVATALGSNFTGSQAIAGNTVTLSLVSPIAITATGGGGGAGVARINLTLSGLTICDATPKVGCLTAGGASFQVKDNADDAKDQVKWKWKKGDAVAQADLGDPDTTATYTLCVYDTTLAVESLVASIRVEPNAGWQSKDPKGWKYKDKTGAENGVQKVQLKTGDAGKSKAQVKAKGAAIPMPQPFSGTEFFDQDTEVIVQLVNDQTATCWTSEFTTAKKNEVDQFKAKAP